jgi:hypothetical protein
MPNKHAIAVKTSTLSPSPVRRVPFWHRLTDSPASRCDFDDRNLARFDGLHQQIVVLFGLIAVGFGEIGQSSPQYPAIFVALSVRAGTHRAASKGVRESDVRAKPLLRSTFLGYRICFRSLL